MPYGLEVEFCTIEPLNKVFKCNKCSTNYYFSKSTKYFSISIVKLNFFLTPLKIHFTFENSPSSMHVDNFGDNILFSFRII